jgi:ADP-ribose pyrophosphatase
MPEPKVLSKETVFRSKYFYIIRLVALRNQKQITKELIVRNDSVFIIPMTEDNQIYLVSQFRDAYEKVMLELVAGTIDNTLSPLSNAQRELKEEAGLTARAWTHLASWDLTSNIKSRVHVFLAEQLVQGTPKPDEDEEIVCLKMPFSEALAKITTGEISVAPQVAALLLLQKRMEEKAAVRNKKKT